MTRSSGFLAFGAASPLAAGLSPLSAFWPLAAACWAAGALSPFSGRGALSDFSGFSPLPGFLASVFLSAIDLDSRTLGDPHLAAVVAFAHELEPDPRRLAVLGIGERQIGKVHRRLLGDDAALLLRGLLLVPLD